MVQAKKDSYQGIASAMPIIVPGQAALAAGSCPMARRLKPASNSR